jgi:hypothetical protein
MRFADFERTARAVWDEIPATYRQGVAGLIVNRSAVPQAEHPDVFTLGECVTEEYPSQYGGPETTRSAVVLYYGSFREVAQEADDFDWEAEIHETIMHELQHHLESLATEDSLDDVDYAVDENFKRLEGGVFDPLFFRAGEPIAGPGTVKAYQVEVDVFMQVLTRDREPVTFAFEWGNTRYRVDLPSAVADVTYIYLEPGPDVNQGEFWLVRVVERGIIGTLRSAFGAGYTVAETTAVAQTVP